MRLDPSVVRKVNLICGAWANARCGGRNGMSSFRLYRFGSV